MFGLYLGTAANAQAGGSPLLRRDGAAIRPAVHDGQPAGYLVTRRGGQLHIFGAALHGTRDDLPFLDRFRFGRAMTALCGPGPLTR